MNIYVNIRAHVGCGSDAVIGSFVELLNNESSSRVDC